ncbi:uncharacterized protein LOC131077208 isoform X2 [Cryptomeria japonica]|uniref:uncharacterized protein LOC131077208 isoform X2 n=1 Tax=Cryptomeria japonica TaxID=3369 RepID=UPI0025ABF491|nr:uncharacterized protein LOC131077208 isoform X2 [Cryptomeria japonica]
MDHFVGVLAGGSLLGNPLDGSSVEVGSSSNVVLYRDDEDECIGKDDDHNIHNGDETHMQQQLQEQGQQLMVSHIEEGFYIDDTHNGVEAHQSKRKRRRGPRLWRDKWQKSYPWAFIRNLNGEERMFCTVCEAHGHTATRNAFRKEGSTNFQQSALATHANSSAHRSALLTQKARAEAGKMGVNGKTRGKASPVPEYGIVSNHLTDIANKLSSLVTREDLESLKAELRLMNYFQSQTIIDLEAKLCVLLQESSSVN